MNRLYIDTHLFDIHIVLMDNEHIICENHIVNEKYNSTFLMPTIIKTIGNNKVDEIDVIIGPGSFTGTRLGVTVAKGLAYSLNIPIKVADYFEIMNYFNQDKDNYYVIYDNNGYFIAHYINNQKVSEYKYITKIEYNKLLENNNVIDNVNVNYLELYNFFDLKELSNVHSVKPIYIKLIGVEK